MPSSTSSSRPSFRQELKVLAVMALVLVASEVGLRALETRTSQEYNRIVSFAQRAETLTSDTAAPRVIVIGNSLADDGLIPEVFRNEVQSLQARIAFDLFALPGSEMCEWYWLFKTHFIDRQYIPDIVVISAARFYDFPRVTISRLAALTESESYAQLMSEDLPTFEERAAFLHSIAFRSFAGRERVQKSILDALIPHYQAGRIWQQKMLRQGMETPEPSLIAPSTNGSAYGRLNRFLDLADEHNILVVLLIMPLSDFYDLDEGLLEIIEKRDVTILDCRKMDNITKESYYDGVHLKAEAAAVFSRQLAHRFTHEVLNTRMSPDRKADIIDIAAETD